MVTKVFWSGVGYCSFGDDHEIVVSVSNTGAEALVVDVRVVACSVVEVSNFFA